jgi:hypothetical protein
MPVCPNCQQNIPDLTGHQVDGQFVCNRASVICENCLGPVTSSTQHLVYNEVEDAERWTCKRAYNPSQAHIKERKEIDNELECERLIQLIRTATIYCTVSSIGSEFFDNLPPRTRFFYIRMEWNGQMQTIEAVLDGLRVTVEPVGPLHPLSVPHTLYYTREVSTLTNNIMLRTRDILNNPKLIVSIMHLEKVLNVIIRKGYILMFYDKTMELALARLAQRGQLNFTPYR